MINEKTERLQDDSPNCGNCKFFRNAPLDPRGGTCRICRPMAFPVQSQAGIGFTGVWAPVNTDEWCGEWQRKETAH